MKMKEMREKAGMTLRQLSDCTGISIQMLSRYERGEVMPSADNATKIAKAYDTSVEEILDNGSNQLSLEEDRKQSNESVYPLNRLIRIIESQQDVIKKLIDKLS